MASHQQLLGRAPFELETMCRRCDFGHIQICLSSLCRTAGIDQSICKSAFELDEFRASRGSQFEFTAIEASLPIESQSTRRFFGGHVGVLCLPHSFTSAKIKHKQPVRIDDATGVDCLRPHPA